MLTFIIPFLVGTIVGFLIRGKPSDTFAITTGRRVAWASGLGFGGVLIGIVVVPAVTAWTVPSSQMAGLIGGGISVGAINILSIKNATYKKWSETKLFAWVCGAIVALYLLSGFLPSEIRGIFPRYERDPVTESAVPSVASGGQDEQAPARITESIEETMRRAEQGEASAQNNLGKLYANGDGVAENDAEAVKWFRLAADQGSSAAQFTLGYMYAIGEGVTESKVDAYFWWNLAAAQGDGTAKRNKGIIEKEMTREQIAEAQRRSAAWKPKTRAP